MTTKVKLARKHIGQLISYNDLQEGDWFSTESGLIGVIVDGRAFYPIAHTEDYTGHVGRGESYRVHNPPSAGTAHTMVKRIKKIIIKEACN